MTATKTKSGPPVPAHIDPDALERAIATARKIKDANGQVQIAARPAGG